MKEEAPEYFVGIDVQVRRGLPYCILNDRAEMTASGWVQGDGDERQAKRIRDVIAEAAHGRHIAIGIDAPRMPLPDVRKWNWDGSKKRWRPRRPHEKGLGRHCEVVLKALNMANPQWTPLIGNSKEWMVLGYTLYGVLGDLGDVYEVFPSASYGALRGNTASAKVNFSPFFPGPKDMLDASVGALTVREYVQNRGWAAGGGDSLGAIILPGTPPASSHPELLKWPG